MNLLKKFKNYFIAQLELKNFVLVFVRIITNFHNFIIQD
jgi:hypothetical protein